MESKLKLYNQMMSSRDEMSASDVESRSREICHRVLLMEEFRTGLRIGLYAAFKNEVRTDILFQEGDRHRKEIYFPAVDKDAGGIDYFRVLKLEELMPTDAGMREPGALQSRLRDLNTLNVLIVPGVAFDLHGGRLGYGKGFYDSCLESFRGKRIALAYDFQVVPELPSSARGRKVDWIVTEKRIVRCM
ncbi:MAG TPA: 5-formyltetrahydrofolate cyclo-ligase [bacterium]|nr:5-formyltetrahydrofolate cyclo-ligase [bacterium]